VEIKLKAGFKPRYNILFRIFCKVFTLFKNTKLIPVIINNFNRLTCLKKQIAWFEQAGFKHIFIIDNKSSYPPLLAYYKQTKHTVFCLDKNVGHTALWDTHIFMLFKNQYYIYTDPDVIPVEECPLNFVGYFKSILAKYPLKGKVGCALKIDDLPETYPLKEEVIAWEKQFWDKELEPNVYDAMVDTTFALYRPNVKGEAAYLPALRVGGDFCARHLPWYASGNLTEEEHFYRQTATKIASWNEVSKGAAVYK